MSVRKRSSILMRGALAAYGDTERLVWVCDSFQGIPDPVHAADIASAVVNHSDLIVSLEEVKRNFARYGLLDDQVRFLKGWFCDTLPTAPIEQIEGDVFRRGDLQALLDRMREPHAVRHDARLEPVGF